MEEEPEAALEHRELHHGEEVDGELLDAGGEPSALLQPADDALDDAAPAVGRLVEARVRTLVRAGRDHGPDAAPAQVAPDGAIAVALVARERAGAGPRPTGAPAREVDPAEQRLDLARLVGLAGGEERDEGDPAAVDQEVELGAEPAARAPERVIGRLTGDVFPPPCDARRRPPDWRGPGWRRCTRGPPRSAPRYRARGVGARASDGSCRRVASG
jgi:hypothetical protein